jgi:nucleoredoxin
MRCLLLVTLLALFPGRPAQAAAPMSGKDVALMVRMGVRDPEIIAEVEKRRLLAPIDAATETALRAGGASEALLASLKNGKNVLSEAEAARVARDLALQREQTARQEAAESEAFRKRQAQLAGASARAVVSDKTRNLFEGKLVRLSGDQVVPVDTAELKHVRLYAIYNSAHWCGPCRQFTPKLVDFYRRIKPQHPELEVIFVSSDRDEFNMTNYMRTAAMPWPAMRWGTGSAVAQQYCGQSIPWLVIVNDAGQPLTQNGIDKQPLDADAVLAALEKHLAGK